MYHTILFLLYLPLKIVHASGNSSYEEFAANCTSMQQSHDPMKNCGSLSFPGKRVSCFNYIVFDILHHV